MHPDGAFYWLLSNGAVAPRIIQRRIKMRWLSMIAAIITVATSVAASSAYAQTCQQLWVERNQYYKNHGYLNGPLNISVMAAVTSTMKTLSR